MSKLILHGVPVSQPYRSVLWATKIKGLPLTLQTAVPPKHTTTDKFKALNPRGTIPVLEDGDFAMCEGPAILAYLADTHGWDDLYPREPQQRARVLEALSWTVGTLRPATSRIIGPLMRPDVAKRMAESPGLGASIYAGPAESAGGLSHVLTSLEAVLEHRPFLASAGATIADLSAYCELGQLQPALFSDPATGLPLFDFSPFARTTAWLDRMRAQPHHDEVHAPLREFCLHLTKKAAKAKAG